MPYFTNADAYAGSVVIVLRVSFLVLFAHGYHFGLEVLVHCEASGLVRRKEEQGGLQIEMHEWARATQNHSIVPNSKA